VSYDDEETQKFMVVLTDGAQTEPAFGPGGARTVSQGESNLEAFCTNAKTARITMITIAYDLGDNATTPPVCGTVQAIRTRISSWPRTPLPSPVLSRASRLSSRLRSSSVNKSFINESL
jgi:hypothetical protein